MFKKSLITTFAVLLLSTFAANAQDALEPVFEPFEGPQVSAERSNFSEGIPSDVRFQLDRQAAIIKSDAELKDYLNSGVGAYGSPLDTLSDSSMTIFLESLQFGSSGLASFNHSVLENELTPTQTYAILELFGFQEAVSTLDHKQVKTNIDASLNNLECESSGIGTDQCPNPEYVDGFCLFEGTCGHSEFSTCHPPSCN